MAKKKRDNKKNVKNLIEKILAIGGILFYSIVSISVIWSLLQNFSFNFLSDFNINPLFYFGIFSLTLLFIAIIQMLWRGIETGEYLRIEKLNYWGISTFAILVTLLFLSFSLYNSYTNYPLPINGSLYINQNEQNLVNQNLESPFFIRCENSRGERDYIINKNPNCEVSLVYKANYSSYLYIIEKYIFLKNGSQISTSNTMAKDQIREMHQFWNFDVPITEDFDHALIIFYFAENKPSVIVSSEVARLWIIPPRILTESDYYQKREQSLIIFMTAISLLLFSVISSIKNFRDLCKKSS